MKKIYSIFALVSAGIVVAHAQQGGVSPEMMRGAPSTNQVKPKMVQAQQTGVARPVMKPLTGQAVGQAGIAVGEMNPQRAFTPTTGDPVVDAQVKALTVEMDAKIKAIADEYRIKIKAVIGDRPIKMNVMTASGTPIRVMARQNGNEIGSGTPRGAVRGVMMQAGNPAENQDSGTGAVRPQMQAAPVNQGNNPEVNQVKQGIGAQFGSLFRNLFGK